MRLHELFDLVNELLPVEARGGPTSAWIGNRLAEHVNTRLARSFYIEKSGLAAVVVVCGEELTRQGRQDAHPELMALAAVLLNTPVVDLGGAEVWPGGVRDALALLHIIREDAQG